MMDKFRLFAFWIGDFDPSAIGMRMVYQNELFEYINSLPGYVGYHPDPGYGTVLFFRDREQAQEAMDALKAVTKPIGDKIMEHWVSESQLKAESLKILKARWE